jgi:chemotaxis protein histidine kinase CheA
MSAPSQPQSQNEQPDLSPSKEIEASKGPGIGVKNVEAFVAAVHRQKNLHRLWTTLIGAIAVGAALLIVVGLCYVLRGYAVPGVWIASICGGVSAAALLFWAARRMSFELAARFMDRFYQLQDAVTSYLHFASQGHHDGYYALQAEQTAERVAKLDAGAIRYQPPKRLVCLAVGLTTLAIPLSLCPPSDEVLDRLAMEKKIESETAAIKEQLSQETEDLLKETEDKEEEELLNPDKLRRMVDELKTTPDRTEALRQYARLDRKLNEMRQSLQRKEDEQLLERAAEELAKGEETKPMADALEKKDYDKAAEKLKNLKPDQAKSPDQQRRDLAKLKATAKRMAMAAKSAKSQKNDKKSPGKSSENAKQSDKNGECSSAKNSSNKSSGQNGSPSDGALSEAIDELAEALDQLDKEECKDKLGECKKCCCEKTDKLADQLKKLAMCKRADCKLGKLCRCCGKCQSQCNSCCASPNAGGLKAGWGSNTARREEKDELVDNGQTTQLQGVKGEGPSDTAVEAADSGSGVASRRGTACERKFKHQFESFVQREDAPEALKDGVKQYFLSIHEADSATSSKGDSTE